MEASLLPPWLQIPYFQPPREVRTAPPVGIWTQVAEADPMRAVLVLAMASATTCYLSILPGKATNDGIALTSQQPWLLVTQADWGAFCNSAWFAYTDGVITALSLSYKQWPKE